MTVHVLVTTPAIVLVLPVQEHSTPPGPVRAATTARSL
jgi:hypothetical protein